MLHGDMDGILRCSKYSFGPNRLHYCGPDANREMASYLKEGVADPGLERILKDFKTLYPYLRFIAEVNAIADPFDDRVVEAYWVGNTLLDAVTARAFMRHVTEVHKLKDRIGGKHFAYLEEKIGRGAVPHHSFHVFNIWMRTGHLERAHTLESMDECRVSWGRVMSLDGPKITVETEPLLLQNQKLLLGGKTRRVITRKLESEADIEQLKADDVISIHWGVPCEKITARQCAALRRYTLQNIAFANETL